MNFALQIPAPGLTVPPKLLLLFIVILFLSETESHKVVWAGLGFAVRPLVAGVAGMTVHSSTQTF